MRLRWRLTLLYCLVSVVSSAVLVLLMYALARSLRIPFAGEPVPPLDPAVAPSAAPGVGVALYPDTPGHIYEPSAIDAVPPLLALAALAVLSLLVGWFIAGRVLQPVLTMTERLHRISDRNVHERLAMPGRRNELKDLADTVDGLLGRLETALDAHKRFVANAAHELRTPLTVEHALLEEPLIDPSADVESFRANFTRLLVITDRRRKLLESLLTLSGSEHGRGSDERFDVTGLVEQALADRASDLEGLRVRTDLQPVWLRGDEVLVARLLENLIDNAIHYNVPEGEIEIRLSRSAGWALVLVSNSGPEIPPEQVGRLFEPFQRLHRVADDDHHGLGLSIVRAIAQAHGATVTARARAGGGLHVQVGFPALASTPLRV